MSMCKLNKVKRLDVTLPNRTITDEARNIDLQF